MKFLFLALLLAGCPSARESVGSVVQLHSAGGVHCSGIVISETEIATARHCVDEGIVEVDDMTLVGTRTSARQDIAIVEVETTNGLPIARIGDISHDATLTGYGCSGELEDSAHVVMYRDGASIYSHGRACPGDSGGGLFNDHGYLIAIHSGISGQAVSIDAHELLAL